MSSIVEIEDLCRVMGEGRIEHFWNLSFSLKGNFYILSLNQRNTESVVKFLLERLRLLLFLKFVNSPFAPPKSNFSSRTLETVGYEYTKDCSSYNLRADFYAQRIIIKAQSQIV